MTQHGFFQQEYHSKQNLVGTSPNKPLKICLYNPQKDNGHDAPDEGYQ